MVHLYSYLAVMLPVDGRADQRMSSPAQIAKELDALEHLFLRFLLKGLYLRLLLLRLDQERLLFAAGRHRFPFIDDLALD